MNLIDKLTKSIATKATGYAAVINGALDLSTTSDSRKLAAMKGMANSGVNPLLVAVSACDDPTCDCVEKAFMSQFPGSRVIAVKVEAVE